MPALNQIRSCPLATPRGAKRTAAAPRRRGATLAELLISLMIVGILMASLGSVMALAGHAVGLSATHAGEVKVDDVVTTITAEMRLARRVTERTSKSITFVVDRDHDGVFDQIRYAWSGVAGAPLTRQLNGGVPVVVVADVQRLNLTYLTKSTAAAAPVPDVEVAADVLLYSHTAGSTASALTTTAWAAQYFKPDWTTVAPGKTVTGWRVTKVEVVASKALGSTGTVPWVVRLYNAGADLKPVLLEKKDELTMSASGLSASSAPSSWVTAAVFGTNAGLDPSKGMCLSVGPQLLSPNGFVSYDNASTDAAGAMVTSSTSGVTWATPSTTRDMRVRVWGRYKYPG